MTVGNMRQDRNRTPASRPRRSTWTALVAVLAILAATLMPSTAASADALTPTEKAQRKNIKREHYGSMALQDANRISAGLQQPIIDFTVVDSPNSIFVNYVIPDDQAAAFAASIPLPTAFSLAKVRILESDPVPRYWLSLNVYSVRGITTGLRAEWSTYVNDGSGSPRFMIVRARAAKGSVDPVGPLAFPEPFTHALGSDSVIRTAMKRTELLFGFLPKLTPKNFFTSEIALPDPPDRQYVVPTREWVAANDFIYWKNGVNDHAFHNAKAHSAQMISVDLADVTIDDDSDWVPFIDPVPGHVLVYLDDLEFVIGPWWNVTEPDGRVPPSTRGSLLGFKNQMYGGFALLNAMNIYTGQGEPTVRSTIEETPPSVYWHWRIPDDELAALEAALDLPPNLSLAPVRLQDDDTEADHWLSLNVFKLAGASPGLRAQWTTYVTDGVATRSLVIESRASERALDPVNLFANPYPLTHTFGADVVDTTVGSGSTAFTSSFTLPPVGSRITVLASRDWAAAKDLTYWTNGIADRVYYDGSLFNAELISLDPGSVSVADTSQWAQFLDGDPDRVWVHQDAYDLVVNPWWNLNKL